LHLLENEECDIIFRNFLEENGTYENVETTEYILNKQLNLYQKFYDMLKKFINCDKPTHFLYLIDRDNLTKKYDSNKKVWIDREKDILRNTTEIKVDAIYELMKLFKVENPAAEHELKDFDKMIRKNYKNLQLFTNKDIYKHGYDIMTTEQGKNT